MPSTPSSSESFASLFEAQPRDRKRRRFHTGDEVEVHVVLIAKDAVFVDLGDKQEGVIERAEVSDGDGKLTVSLGSRVVATVTGFESGTGQVKLKPKAIKSDDGQITAAGASSGPLVVEGARVKGHVTGIERYGVFVQIAGTKDRAGRGLVPTAETGTPRGSDLKKHFTVGQELEVKILQIESDGKIRMSVSALKADEERKDLEAYAKAEEKRQATSDRPVRGFGTLGDLMKAIPAKPAAPAPAKPAAPANRALATQRSSGPARGRKA